MPFFQIEKTVNSKPPTITIGIVARTFSDNLSRNSCIFKGIIKPGGDYSQEFLVGVCRPVLQILTLCQTKKCHFHTRFQTRPVKSRYPFSDLAFRQKLCYHYLVRAQTKKIFKSISNSHISLSFLLIWN